ncbi:MAG: starch-binding protein, partial [Acutalibacteraceae bacterium]
PDSSETDPPSPDYVKLSLNANGAFSNADVYAYAYNTAGGENSPWPGEQMTKNSDGTYSLNVLGELDSVIYVGVYSNGKFVQSPEYPVSSDPVTLETVTIKYEKPSGWSNMYAHMWLDGGATSTEWPGIPMVNTGGNSYELTIPDYVYDTVMFDDVETNESYQTSSMLISSITGDPDVTYPTSTDPIITDPVGDLITVSVNPNGAFTGAEGIYVYAFNSAGGENSAWPGVLMNNNGNGTYSASIDSTFDQVIFVGNYGASNGGTIQSQTYIASTDLVTIETETIKYTKPSGWSNINVHMWKDGADSATTWPGVPMNFSSGNDYTLTIPAGVYDTCIFSNAGQSQTQSIAISTVISGGGESTDPIDPDPITGDKLYLDTTTIASANMYCRWAAYFFKSGADNKEWVDMTLSSGNTYEVTIPSGYDKVIFVRMNVNSTENDWKNKYNQTEDLSFTAGGTYKITGWGTEKMTGSW